MSHGTTTGSSGQTHSQGSNPPHTHRHSSSGECGPLNHETHEVPTPTHQNNNANTVGKDEDSFSYSSFYCLTPPAAAAALSTFQYKGQDLSLVYKYILSPLADVGVHRFTPRTVAPNTITLVGLLFMVAAYAILWYYQPLLFFTPTTNTGNNKYMSIDEEPVPRWVFLFNAMAILLYQTLDNMDGKQARRVSASSPLGLFFDHGCDAVNSLFGSANWIVALALSSSNQNNDLLLSFIMLMGPYALFYFGTWEEYYTGQLIMPIFNGPNEGLLGAVCVSVLSYSYGPLYWHTTSWWDTATTVLETHVSPFARHQLHSGLESILPTRLLLSLPMSPLRNADVLILASGIAIAQELVLKTLAVTRHYGWQSLWNLVPFLTLVACSLLVGCNDSGDGGSIWIDMPRTSLHLCAILFVEMTTDLMLMHMTKQQYQPFRWILIPLVLFSIAVAAGLWPTTDTTTTGFLSMSDFLLIYSAAAGAYLVLKTVVLIHEITIVLNIWCFDIVTPRTKIRPQQHQDSGITQNGNHN